jgi:hypothetical protein
MEEENGKIQKKLNPRKTMTQLEAVLGTLTNGIAPPSLEASKKLVKLVGDGIISYLSM